MRTVLAALLFMLVEFAAFAGQNTTTPKPASTPDAVKADTPKPAAPKVPVSPIAAEWQTKIFELQFADPDAVRSLFSDRSAVMETNRQLRTVTAHGPPAFLKEVEDAVKRFDVPPSAPANVQLMVYLLTKSEQAPGGVAVPAELSAIAKEFGSGARLADTQVLRVREAQTGQVTGVTSKPDAASLSRVWLQSAMVGPGPKGERVSLYGLRIWLNIPSTPPAAIVNGFNQLHADPDVSADIDVDPNQAVMVSKVGIDQPVMVVVRATVIR